MTRQVPRHHGYRFPREIISHAIWLYHVTDTEFGVLHDYPFAGFFFVRAAAAAKDRGGPSQRGWRHIGPEDSEQSPLRL